MNHFWFPPLPLHYVLLGCFTGVSLGLMCSSKAIAQSPPAPSSHSLQQLIDDGERFYFASDRQWIGEDAINVQESNRPIPRPILKAMDIDPSVLEPIAPISDELASVHHPLFTPNAEHTRVVEALLNTETPGLLPPNPEHPQGYAPWATVERDSLGADRLVVGTVEVELAQVDDATLLDSEDSADPGGDDRSEVNPLSPSLDTLDPELGILRLRPLSNEASGVRSSAAVLDPELGVLRLRAIPQTSEPSLEEKDAVVFVQGNLGFFSGNNLLARTDPLSDVTLQSGLSVRAVPRLGPRTFLVGTAGGSVLKYADHGEFDYRELDLNVGIYHWLNRRTYVDVGWRNQQFFAEDGGDRFLNDHQARLSIGRTDQLTSDLRLDSAYHLQASWADPSDRSRFINRLSVGLSHPITSKVDASVFYQLALIDFTQQDRYDSYHQFLAQLQFGLSEDVTLTIFGGGRLGDSTHSLIDFDSTLLGISLAMNFALF